MLEQKIKAYAADRDPLEARDVSAVVAATKYAAALGCIDAEVQAAGWRADAVADARRWRAERHGIDEPRRWVELASQEGRLRKLLEAGHQWAA